MLARSPSAVPPRRAPRPHSLPLFFLLLGAAWLLMGCALQRPVPVLKVGLLAPFDGERREVGYHLLPAIRAATPERVQGYRVEWVILDTHGDPTLAAQRARELLADPALLAIVGPALPEEVGAVAPLVEGAGVAWWPLAPSGEEALEAWAGEKGGGLEAGQRWGARAWPAVRRGTVTRYLDPRLPADLGDFAAVGGEQPWPQAWLAWEGTRHAFDALARSPRLDRAAVLAAADTLPIPPPALYQSEGSSFPGRPVQE